MSDPSWAYYPETILEIHASPILQVDLRVPVAPMLAETLRGLGLGPSWAIVTGHNPHGRSASSFENEARERELFDIVAVRGVAFVRADELSPDGSHREGGIAVALSRGEAVALAKRFGQSALFWFDGEAFWVVPALLESPATPLPIGEHPYRVLDP